MAKDKGVISEIHLKQLTESGYSLRTKGTIENIADDIVTLQAWFINEYIDPKRIPEYLKAHTEHIERKLNKKSIQSVEVDLENLIKQMGGKE